MKTDRLRIHRFSHRHMTERYVGWLNDPETVKFSEQRHKTHTLTSCQEYVRSHVRLWAIEHRGTHIGNIAADVDHHNLVADITILLGEERGKGLGTEAFKAFSDYWAKYYRKLTCGCMSVNYGMRIIATKAGYEQEAIQDDQFLYEGGTADLVRYARFT